MKIDRYEVVEELRAGMYRARDPELRRDVSIKLVDSPPGDDAERRLDEARAMAKVSHPRLVPIFDVGATRDGIYVVMPYVSGGTLATWLGAEARPWAAILDQFVKAGRGLAAAHAAGLVHGAFSAEHVVLEREDVLVGDFGLAAGDAQADRDAFAKAFLAALDGRGPAWLVAILERAWPSTSAMLDRIESRRRLPARVAIGAVAVSAVAAAAVGFVALRGSSPPPCPTPTARVAQAWSLQRRADLERAMLSAKVPYAADAVARVLPAIDTYVNDWSSMYIATCRATQVAHTQPAAMLDKRMRCLDRRLSALSSRVGALLDAKETAALKSAVTVASLPAVTDCADETSLEKMMPLPADPQRRAAVETLQAETTDLESFGIAGDPAEYLRRAHALVARTRIQDYVPAHVMAMHSLATAQGRNKQTAELTLRELVATAARAGDDVSMSLAWSSLVFQMVSTQRFDEAKQLLAAATTATTRAGNRRDALFSLTRVTGVLACEMGDQATCIGTLKEAVALAPNGVHRSDTLQNLIAGYANPGDFASAKPLVEEMLALNEQLVGTNHPRYADALYFRARLRFSSGDAADLERGLEDVKRIIDIRAGAFGENHPDVAATLVVQASILGSQSKHAEAEAASRRALAIADAIKDPTTQVEALRLVGATTSSQHRPDEAKAAFERALTILRELYGEDSRDYASMASTYAAVLEESGDCPGVLTYAKQSLVTLERLHDTQAEVSLTMLAMCSLETAPDDAVAYFKRALAICDAPGSCVTGHKESILSDYGEFLIKSGRDRQGGAVMVRTGRDFFAQMGRTEDVEILDALLTKFHLPLK